jgi:hypothetical protein
VAEVDSESQPSQPIRLSVFSNLFHLGTSARFASLTTLGRRKLSSAAFNAALCLVIRS